MNRIRKVDNAYQVLITPDIKISPDSALLIGNWEDESLRNFYVLQFESLNDAQAEALKYPDLDWYKIVLNHKYIFGRLQESIQQILDENKFSVEFKATLMDPDTFKNTMMDRVVRGGERFNMRYGMSDLISFTIINPWSNNLHNISKQIENYRTYLFRDDLRLRSKKVVDGYIICLYGITEFGTVYEIKLIPSLLYQWGEWYNKVGNKNQDSATQLWNKLLKQQKALDNGIVLK